MKKILAPVLLSLVCSISYATPNEVTSKNSKDTLNANQMKLIRDQMRLKLADLNKEPLTKDVFNPIYPYTYNITIEKENKANPSNPTFIAKYNGSGIVNQLTAVEDIKSMAYIKKCETSTNQAILCTPDTVNNGFYSSIYASFDGHKNLQVEFNINKKELLILKDVTKNGITIQIPDTRTIRIKNFFEYSGLEKKTVVYKSSDYETPLSYKDGYIFTLTLEPSIKTN